MTFINSGTNPLTASFLHMSGAGETRERAYAWVGTRNQFYNLCGSLDVDYELHSALGKKNDRIEGA